MATDRIGIEHVTCEVAGALMSSGTKRKVEELGGHVVSAVVGGVVDLSMSAAVARYEARTSVDDKLDRLCSLSIKVHSAVEAAEGVHIPSWWLRRWLWTLRDAALDADEVLRLFRQRPAAEDTDAANNQAAGNMVWRALRSVKSLLFGRRGDDGGVERLTRVVARLEREAIGLGEFLKVLNLEIRRSLALQLEPVSPVQPAPPVLLEPPVQRVPPVQPESLLPGRYHVFDDMDKGMIDTGDNGQQPPDSFYAIEYQEDSFSAYESRFGHGLSPISQEEYVAGMRKMGLLVVRQRIRRALDRLIKNKPATPPASRALTPDTDRLREQVTHIRRAVLASSGTAGVDFHSKRSWLSRWSNQLMTVARTAEYLLPRLETPYSPSAGLFAESQKSGMPAVPVQAGGDGDGTVPVTVVPLPRDINIRTAAHSVEMAAAHLEDFVTLTGFAVASLGR